MRDRKQADKSEQRNAVRTNDERPARLVSVGEHRKEYRAGHPDEVDGDREQLGICGRVTKLEDDGGRRVREAVQTDAVAPVDDDGQVDLPVRQGGAEVSPLETIVGANLAGRCACVLSEAADDKVPFGWGEEARRLRRVRERPVQGAPDHDGGHAFEDEDPTPAAETSDAIHLFDSERQQAGKCASQ